MLEKLKTKLHSSEIQYHTRYYIKIPNNAAHENHCLNSTGSLFAQPLHKDIIEKIYEIVSEGIINPRVIKLQIHDFVKHVILKDSNIHVDEYNTTYYPDLKTISDHVRLALRAHRYNQLDQTSLQEKINEWSQNKNKSFFFRPQSSDNDKDHGSSFLFVYQENWQKSGRE